MIRPVEKEYLPVYENVIQLQFVIQLHFFFYIKI